MVDGAGLLWLTSATVITAIAAITTIARVTPAHILADEAGSLGAGAPPGGLNAGGAGGRVGGVERVVGADGLEWTTGMGGASGATLTGAAAAVFSRYWASSMALPNT